MEGAAFTTTGVPQLDLILGGGIVQNSLLLIVGPAGSGKTVLASEIAFAAADRNERVLFVTAFSEPHNKLIANLLNFRFFNREYIGGRIKLLNLQHQLETSTDEAADTIVREARDHKAQIVVLDGFQAVRISSDRPAGPHHFLYDLSAKLSLLGVVGILTYDLPAVADPPPAEFSVVDGIVLLSQELIGDQAIRVLQVIKQRGTRPLLGRHSFHITDDGIICFPRQEAVTSIHDVQPGVARVQFGIPALDKMLGGGVNEGTTTIIAGAEGAGKTLLGIQYLKQALEQNECAVFVSFHETPQQLVFKARNFGLDLQVALDAGTLIAHYYPPAELNADLVAQRLRDVIDAQKVQRLVIDGINEIELPLIERGRAHGFFASLITFLRSRAITSCITLEIDPVIGRELSFAGKTFSALADNILLMQRFLGDGQHTNAILVLKMRFSAHDRLPRLYTVGEQGLEVSSDASD